MISRPLGTRHLALVAVASLAACRSAAPGATPQPPAPPPSAAEATPARPATPPAPPHSLRWSRDSAEHRAIFLQVYRAATAHVESEAAKRPGGGWAVVADADETVIDNSLYELEAFQAGRSFGDAAWHAWTRRRAAVPLPGAKAFLARVRALGGRIAIVTNRSASACPDTEAVFHAHALPFDVMLCKPDAGPSDKNPRFEAVANGTTPAGLPPLEIVAVLGDNINDFPGQSQAIRHQGDEAFAAFGTRFFVFPNPMYGSWQRN